MVPFAGGDWLAGLKFNYKYANINSKQNVSIPQNGTVTILSRTGRTTESITGFVQISPAEINLKHQLALIATIGRAFGNVHNICRRRSGTVRRRDEVYQWDPPLPLIRGQGRSPAGEPITSLNDNWVWGGAAQVGATYAFAGGWFLDFAYTYARSANFNIENSACYSNQIGPLASSGCAVLNAQERVTNQSVMLTLNRRLGVGG